MLAGAEFADLCRACTLLEAVLLLAFTSCWAAARSAGEGPQGVGKQEKLKVLLLLHLTSTRFTIPTGFPGSRPIFSYFPARLPINFFYLFVRLYFDQEKDALNTRQTPSIRVFPMSILITIMTN